MVGASYQNPVGHCISLVKPFSPPAQKLLLDKPILDGENFDQSNFPRHDIPGHAVRIHLKEENNLSSDDTKYYVHPNGMWSINAVKIKDDSAASRVNSHAMNLTENTTHDHAPPPHKKSTKGTVIVISCGFILFF